jgi:ribonuclease J
MTSSNLKQNKNKKDQKPLKIIAVGGMEEVGRNMTLLEYEDEIVVIDAGLQFPEEDMPGIDYIIPNPEYLRQNAQKIKGILITHGHYDHIGALPHILAELGNPLIYTGRLTRGMILKRQEDFPGAPKPKIKEVRAGQKIKLGGNFEAEFVHINHNIPDSFALSITTPLGRVIHTGDFKFDRNPYQDRPADISRFANFGKEGTLLLIADSTNAEQEGFSLSESEIKENLEQIFDHHQDKRLIVGTFGSLLTRVQQIFDLAQKYGRKVAVDGYSMKTNIEIAQELGYIQYPKSLRIPIKEVSKFPPEKVVIIGTGAQGEGNAVLMRIAQKAHKFIRLTEKDLVIFSSSIVPGNERTVQSLKDVIYRQGAKVLDYKMMDIHAGGHARREDLKLLINLTRPKFFIPAQANYYLLKIHAELAEKMGIPKENILILGNGQIGEVTKNSIQLAKETVPASYVFVDGLGVGDVGDIVMRDRQKMAEDGMFVIIVRIEGDTGKVEDNVDVISRGFVYMSHSQELISGARKKAREITQKAAVQRGASNWSYIKDELRNKLGKYLFQKTHRRPLILPVVLQV